jgi:hypothetical protein
MSEVIHFGVSSAWLVGECEKCKQPTTGEIQTDNCYLIMKCVSCYHSHEYIINEEDRNYGYYIKLNELEGDI